VKIRLFLLHRGANYGVEALAVVDEYTLDDNPTYWEEEKVRQREMTANDGRYAEVELSVDEDDLLAAFEPTKARAGSVRTVKED
jgi:hypothetical protein